MLAFTLRRAIQAIGVMLAVGLISFSMFRFAGDPVNQMVSIDISYAERQAIRKVVASYGENLRVGVLASGGLSHFLVDEDFDRAILKACADKDAQFLKTLPRNKLHAGSSEILNWVAVAGAVEHLDLTWFEYVPGYRTPAGTGTGLSFATWA